ncbi:hypothetical protein ACFY00_16550 [Kitasatospora sp. NPDC001540]
MPSVVTHRAERAEHAGRADCHAGVRARVDTLTAVLEDLACRPS